MHHSQKDRPAVTYQNLISQKYTENSEVKLHKKKCNMDIQMLRNRTQDRIKESLQETPATWEQSVAKPSRKMEGHDYI